MRFTHHALDAMRRRDVTREEVEFVVRNCEQSYQQRSRHGNEATVYQWQHLAVVAAGQTVLTILSRQPGMWSDADVRATQAAQRRRNGL